MTRPRGSPRRTGDEAGEPGPPKDARSPAGVTRPGIGGQVKGCRGARAIARRWRARALDCCVPLGLLGFVDPLDDWGCLLCGAAIVVALIVLLCTRPPTHWIHEWAEKKHYQIVRLDCKDPGRLHRSGYSGPATYRAEIRDEHGVLQTATIC